jgi:hypothetical protein
LLKKHDEITKIQIYAEWLDRIQHESFGIQDSFEKTIALTKVFVYVIDYLAEPSKDIVHSLTPSVDDFQCAICLGLLCEVCLPL